jgi:tRNA G37 N-methylase TrmD
MLTNCPEALIWKGKKYKVPKVLIEGNHKKIAEWRKNKSK